jgi:hypothetical protein
LFGFEDLSRNLLKHHRYGADKVVSYGDLFVLDEKDALVGFRPEAIQAFDVILPTQRRIVPRGFEDIEGMHTHHIRGEYLLVTPRDFQITMSAGGLQHEPVSRVSGRLQQTVNRNIQFRDIKLRHSRVLLSSALCSRQRSAQRGNGKIFSVAGSA